MGPTQSGDNDRDSMFLPGMEDIGAPDGQNARPAAEGRIESTGGTESKPATEIKSTARPDMSADANQLNIGNAGAPQVVVEPTPTPAPQPPEFVEPLWMRRSKLVIFVIACIYLGIILVILPWNEVWTQNGLIHRYPALREIAMNNFLRGAITGLGFVNVWLGIWEAVGYREQKRR